MAPFCGEQRIIGANGGCEICGLSPEFVSIGAQNKGFLKVNWLLLHFGAPY